MFAIVVRANRSRFRDAAIRAAAPRPRSASVLRYSPGLVLVAIAIADFVRRADPDLLRVARARARAALGMRGATLRRGADGGAVSYSAPPGE